MLEIRLIGHIVPWHGLFKAEVSNCIVLFFSFILERSMHITQSRYFETEKYMSTLHMLTWQAGSWTDQSYT